MMANEKIVLDASLSIKSVKLDADLEKTVKIVTPNTETKTLSADFSSGDIVVLPSEGKTAMTQVTILKDPNQTSGNIRAGATIAGTAGSFSADTTATAADIARGKTAAVNGEMVTGTFVPPVVEAPENDVIFYDYDGTRLYSYSADEFAELTEMPPLPQHDRLTCEGWNWSLNGAKNYVRDYGILDIAAPSYPTDEKVHLFIELEEPLISPMLGINVRQAPTTISWGDGSPDTVLSTTGEQYIRSPYTMGGKYEITIDGNFYFPGNHVYTNTFSENGGTPSSAFNYTNPYTFCLKEAWIGDSYWNGTDYGFLNLPALQVIAQKSSSIFRMNSNSQLKAYFPKVRAMISYHPASIVFSVPEDAACNLLEATSVGFRRLCISPHCSLGSTFGGTTTSPINYLLTKVVIPEGITAIGGYGTFANCRALTEITFPSTVTTIGTLTLANDYAMRYVTFKSLVPATVENISAWQNINPACIFIVPYASLADYLVATNYPSSATYSYYVFATYASGATLPTTDTTEAYSITWYTSITDAQSDTSPITEGNGKKIYGAYQAI